MARRKPRPSFLRDVPPTISTIGIPAPNHRGCRMKIDFTPVVYEHAARFVGRSPWDVSRDPELMFEGHRRAYLEYRQQVIAVGIDIYNLEAEAYGARIEPVEGDAIPAIRKPLLERLEDGFELKPFDANRHGRIAMVLSVGQRLKREFPAADIRIPVAGPFSIAFNLRGINDLCLDAALRPADTVRFLMRLAENQAVLCRAISTAGLDVAFFESAAAPPILSPRQFRDLELPALEEDPRSGRRLHWTSGSLHYGREYVSDPRRHPRDGHELSRCERRDQPSGVCRFGLAHPPPRQGPCKPRPRRGCLPRAESDPWGYRPRPGDRWRPSQLPDGNRRHAAGDATRKRSLDSRISCRLILFGFRAS